MGIDIVRQPLMAALITLLLFVVAATIGIGMPVAESGLAVDCSSVLGGYLLHAQQTWPVCSVIVCGIILFVTGALLGRMAVRYALYAVHTYLVVPLYGLLILAFCAESGFIIGVLCGGMLVSSLGNFYACFRTGSYAFGEMFRGALFLGLIPLIYTPSWFLAAVLPLSVLFFKRSLRELIVAVAGYVLPFVTVCYLNWAMGGAFLAPLDVVKQAFASPWGFVLTGLAPLDLIAMGFVVILFLLAILSYLLDQHILGSKSRSIQLFNLFLSLIAGAMFFAPCESGVAGMVVAVPVAMALPMLFLRLSRGVAVLLYLTFIVVCVLRIF